MVALPPIALVAGPAAIDWSFYGPAAEVRLSNHSAFVLIVRVPGGVHNLDPYTADRYQLRGATGLTYQALATVSPATAGTLLVTLADQPGERIPGAYPLHLR